MKIKLGNSRSIPPFDHERFLSKIKVNQETECWEWTLFLDRDGYGDFSINRGHYKAHRISYDLFVKKLTPGLVIDHLCKNRKCCNPDHLREVTVTVNSLDNSDGYSAINIRKTHCVNGHEFTPENTYKRNRENGGRQCRQCVFNRIYKKRGYLQGIK